MQQENRMRKKAVFLTILSMFLVGALIPQESEAKHKDRGPKKLEVTLTNLTSSIVLTPPVFASSYHEISVFELTEPASEALEMVAEGGDTTDLALLFEDNGAMDVVKTSAPVLPGQSVSILLDGDKRSLLSFASMLLPTNDAFVGLSSVELRKWRTTIFYLYAYDAGTEDNDEICANIPGPLSCGGGEGFNSDSGEGYIFPHAGIHGEGEISVQDFGWGNPVAKVSVRIVSE